MFVMKLKQLQFEPLAQLFFESSNTLPVMCKCNLLQSVIPRSLFCDVCHFSPSGGRTQAAKPVR